MFCLEITSIILLTQKETQCGYKIEFINPEYNTNKKIQFSRVNHSSKIAR
jgi:hypothetical protein